MTNLAALRPNLLVKRDWRGLGTLQNHQDPLTRFPQDTLANTRVRFAQVPHFIVEVRGQLWHAELAVSSRQRDGPPPWRGEIPRMWIVHYAHIPRVTDTSEAVNRQNIQR